MNVFLCIRAIGHLLLLFLFMSPNQAHSAVTLNSSFSVNGAYTDNLFFDESGQESDFGIFLGPNLSLFYNDPDIVLGVSYFGRVQLFLENSNANRYVQNANINLDLPFLSKQYKGLTVNVDESMNFTPQLDAFSLSGNNDAANAGTNFGGTAGNGGFTGTQGVQATGVAGSTAGGGVGGGTGVFSNRTNAFSNNAGITVGYDLTQKINSSLRYSNQYLHFFEDGFQDSLTHTGFVSFSYQLTPQTGVTPSYSYTQTDFLGESTQGTQADKFVSHNVQLGISHALTAALTASISGGVAWTKQFGAIEQEIADGQTVTRNISSKWNRNFVGTANITYTYRQGSVNGFFNQTIGNGGGLAAQATQTRTFGLQLQHNFSQRLNGLLSLNWAHNDSIGGNALETDTYQIQASLGYTFTNWLVGNLGYSHIVQKSSGTAATDLNVDQIFLGLTAQADPWTIIR